MADLAALPKVEIEVTLKLTESEARALLALTAYGEKAFLQVFYEHLGRSCLEPHQAGLVSLFKGVTGVLPPILKRADGARTVFNGGVYNG